MRREGLDANNLIDRLSNDPGLEMTRSQLEEAISSPIELVGTASRQISNFVSKVKRL